MITRPVRSGGRVWLVTSHVSQVMEESGLTLVGYHLAVSQDGRDEWQVLVGEGEPRVRGRQCERL